MLGFVRSKGLACAVGAQTRLALGARAASTVGATLDEAVARLPHKEALRSVKQEIRWSFKELNETVDELANGFLGLKFAAGDVVAVWLPNSAENVVTQLAAAKAGLTLAVIEPEVSLPEEIAFVLQDSKASGLIFEPKMAGRDQTAIVQQMFPELATFRQNQTVFRPKAFRHLHSVITTGFEPVEGMIHLKEMMVNSAEPYAMKAVTKTLSAKTPFAVTYSKVEGQNPKKSAVATHGDVLKQAEKLVKGLKLTASDKILVTGEQGGLSAIPFAAIETSSQVVLPSTEFSDEAVAQAMKVEGCSIVGSGADSFKRV